MSPEIRLASIVGPVDPANSSRGMPVNLTYKWQGEKVYQKFKVEHAGLAQTVSSVPLREQVDGKIN